jgi:hypothetical protein
MFVLSQTAPRNFQIATTNLVAVHILMPVIVSFLLKSLHLLLRLALFYDVPSHALSTSGCVGRGVVAPTTPLSHRVQFFHFRFSRNTACSPQQHIDSTSSTKQISMATSRPLRHVCFDIGPKHHARSTLAVRRKPI